MRRLIGALLAASILAPAVAQAQREGYRGEGRGQIERGGPRGNGGDRPTRPDRGPDGVRADRPRADAPRPDTARPDTARPDTRYDAPRADGPRGDRWPAGADRRGDGRDRADRRRDRPDGIGAGDIPRGADLRSGRPDRAAIEASGRSIDDRRFRDGRRDDDGRGRDWTSSRLDGDRGYGRDDRRGDRGDWNGGGGRSGWDDRGRDDRNWGDRGRGNAGWSGRNGNRWDRGWHGQSRYDWTRYRDTNRGAFRLPRYDAPGGWNGGYRRFGIGFSLSSALWGRNYWIGDPYAYRLPEVYGPYRWVRYYDDALLVDVRSGQIVDAVYGIFW